MVNKDGDASGSREHLLSAEELTKRLGGLGEAIMLGEALDRISDDSDIRTKQLDDAVLVDEEAAVIQL